MRSRLAYEELLRLRAIPPFWGGLETDGGSDEEPESGDTGAQTDTGTGSGRIEGSPTGGQRDPRGGLAGVMDAIGSGLEGLGVRSDYNFGIDPSLQVGGPEGVSTEGGGARGQGRGDTRASRAGAGAGGAGAGGAATAGYTDPYAALAASLGLDTGMGGGGAGTGGTGAGTGKGSSILDKLLGWASTYVPYLESTDLPQTTEGQAIMGSAYGPIDTAYRTAVENLKNTLGPPQGNSGVLQEAEAQAAQNAAAQKAAVQRDFASSYTQRGQQALSDLTALLQEEQATKAAGLGIEENLGQTQQQDLLNLLNAVSGGTGAATAAGDLGSGLLSFAGQENAAANAQLANANAGLASLAASLGARTGAGGGAAGGAVPQTTAPSEVPGIEALMLGNPTYWRGNPLVTG